MGTWGNGILQDDIADDMRIAFRDACAKWLSIKDATQRVLDQFRWRLDRLDDEDDGCRTILALAALQLQAGILTQDIRQRAIEAAASECAIGLWESSSEAEEEFIAARRGILSQFKTILERGCCTREEWEQVCYPKEFSLW
jgi:hypothetical protein